ncbi:amino acid ABC transporter ATP-binding/permease protein [Aliidiomarina iranensis]|nr:ATP-binding cassette domain-containing protein [Aliidiomarina iranensis]
MKSNSKKSTTILQNMFYKGLKQERKRLLLGFACMFVTAAAGVGLLALSGWFITASALTGIATAAGILVLFDIFTPGTGIRVFALMRTVGRYFERIFHHDAVLRVQARWRVAFFHRLSQKPAHSFAKLRTGTVLQRLTQDLNILDGLYLRLLAPPAVAGWMLILVLILISAFSWRAAPEIIFLIAVVLPFLWYLAVIKARQKTEALGRQELRASAAFRQQSMDFYEGMAELFGAGRLAQNSAEQRQLGATINRFGQERLQRIAAIENVLQFLLQSLALAVLLFGLHAYSQEQMSLPIAVMQALAILALAEVLVPLAEQSSQIGLVNEAAERLHDLNGPAPSGNQRQAAALRFTDKVKATAATANIENAEGTANTVNTQSAANRANIEIAENTENTENTGEALPGLNLQGLKLPLRAGKITAVLGSSGSGKSTMAQVFAGIRELPGIQVFIETDEANDKVSNKTQPDSSWLGQLGYVTQANLVLAGTIATNLRIAAPRASDEELWRALTFAAFADEVRAMPEQLETWVGTAGLAISGGQARRLVLARLYLQNPAVVILDEPCTGLDGMTATKIKNTLEEWLVGRTCLMLGHKTEALPKAHYYFKIAEGKLQSLG